MRRKDREVTDFSEIVKIIDRCAVVRLGLADGDFPYIVPLNFAYTVTGRQIYLYVHGAVAGRKYELMRRSGIEIPDSPAAGSVVHVSRGDTYLGSILISDRIKQDAKRGVDAEKDGLSNLLTQARDTMNEIPEME